MARHKHGRLPTRDVRVKSSSTQAKRAQGDLCGRLRITTSRDSVVWVPEQETQIGSRKEPVKGRSVRPSPSGVSSDTCLRFAH